MRILRLLAVVVGVCLIGRFVVVPMFGTTLVMQANVMSPVIQKGDKLFIKKMSPSSLNLQPQDLIAFIAPSSPTSKTKQPTTIYIGRVIALEGQRVQIVNKEVLVDGAKASDPFKQITDQQVYKVNKPVKQMNWEARDYFWARKTLRDNFNPAVTVPSGNVFVLCDNRDIATDSRYFGPIALTDIIGKPTRIYSPMGRAKSL